MSRLIDVDAVVNEIDNMPTVTDTNGAKYIEKTCLRIRINTLPPVDAVPVVRCADCIRFRPDDDVWGWCTVSGKMRCKDYCSYGVRKDGDHHEG